MGLFKRTKSYSMTISRSISELETIQVLLTADKVEEFAYLLTTAEAAIQLRADEFQKQLYDAQKLMEKEREAKYKAKKEGK